MTNKSTNDKKSYETAVSELEQILTQLENNQLPLEEAIKQFESGVSLIKHCQEILDKTEQKVKGLMGSEESSENTEDSDILF